MKTDFIRIALLITAVIISGCSTLSKEARQIRVLSYNIHHGRGMDRKIDLERIAKVINSVNPDIVALQEVERNSSRTGKVDQARILGELTGMHHTFGKAINFGGGQYGNALLSKFPIKSVKNFPLPGEPRNLLEATLVLPESNEEIVFLATHLDTNKKPQMASLPTIAKRVAANKNKLMLLAGDFNALPESETLKILKKDWTNATSGPKLFTSPNPATKQIDYVCYKTDARWRVIQNKVLAAPVESDHLPILSVLELTTD